MASNVWILDIDDTVVFTTLNVIGTFLLPLIVNASAGVSLAKWRRQPDVTIQSSSQRRTNGKKISLIPMGTPPGWVFMLVWCILYALLLISMFLTVGFNEMSYTLRNYICVFIGFMVTIYIWPIVFGSFQMHRIACFIVVASLGLCLTCTILVWNLNTVAFAFHIITDTWLAYASYLNIATWYLEDHYGSWTRASATSSMATTSTTTTTSAATAITTNATGTAYSKDRRSMSPEKQRAITDMMDGRMMNDSTLAAIATTVTGVDISPEVLASLIMRYSDRKSTPTKKKSTRTSTSAATTVTAGTSDNTDGGDYRKKRKSSPSPTPSLTSISTSSRQHQHNQHHHHPLPLPSSTILPSGDPYSRNSRLTSTTPAARSKLPASGSRPSSIYDTDTYREYYRM